MRRHRVLLLLVFLAGATAARAADAPAARIAQYRNEIAHAGLSAPALFGLGTTLSQTGKPGWAILELERAQALAPREAGVAHALAVARMRAGINVPARGLWMRAAGELTDDTWAVLAAAAVTVLCAGLGWLALAGAAGWGVRVMIFAGLGAVCLCADVIALRWQELDRAVMVSAAAAHIAPAQNAETSFQLRAGETVYPQDRFGAFERVRTVDGRVGWVERSLAVPVLVDAAQAAAEDVAAP